MGNGTEGGMAKRVLCVPTQDRARAKNATYVKSFSAIPTGRVVCLYHRVCGVELVIH